MLQVNLPSNTEIVQTTTRLCDKKVRSQNIGLESLNFHTPAEPRSREPHCIRAFCVELWIEMSLHRCTWMKFKTLALGTIIPHSAESLSSVASKAPNMTLLTSTSTIYSARYKHKPVKSPALTIQSHEVLINMPSSILPREGLTLEAIVQPFRATLLQPWLTAPLLLATLVAPTSTLALSNLLHPQLTLHALQQIIITFLALGTIYDLNNLLSRLILNNWILTTPWDWSQEIVLVTGGCSGIGEIIVQTLTSRNIKVVVFDIADPRTSQDNVSYYKLDITSSSAIKAAAEKVRTDIGHPTVVINNAGIGTVSTILDATENSILGTFNVNVIAQYLMIKEFLPEMVKQDHGHIVTIASMASYLVHAGNVAYASSKAAVLAFHEGLGQELKSCYGAKRVRTT